MRTVLVLRLSSMGDVLLTIPVLQGIVSENPDLQIILVTQSRFSAYFSGIKNLNIIEFTPGDKHKGIPGIIRLFRELQRLPIERVVDLHGILRTYLLDILFLLTLRKVFLIRKFRGLRRKILNGNRNQSIPHTTQRYLDVFNRAGFSGRIISRPLAQTGSNKKKQEVLRIGIAPLARHSTKNWSQSHVITLIDMLLSKYLAIIYLFGGPEDKNNLEVFTRESVLNSAGTLNQDLEIELVTTMDLFISMDSANMHLASLAGVPTLSIWGATDPSMGFSALGQPDTYSLFSSSPEVYCRPCSVYGARPCHRSDHPMICMDLVMPDRVFRLAEEILGKRNKIS